MIRDLKDFCFEARGKMLGGACVVNISEDVCKRLQGKPNTALGFGSAIAGCTFSDTRRAQERIGTIKMSPALSDSERRSLISLNLSKLPPEMKDFSDELVEITAGLNAVGIHDTIEALEEEYLPVEERVKKSGLYDSSKPLEPQIRAFELAHGFWQGTKRAFAGISKEDREEVGEYSLLPAVEAVRTALEERKNLLETERQLRLFTPDNSNRHVWQALVKNPDSLEVWGENPKPFPEGIKSIKKYPTPPYGGQEKWIVIDGKGDGAIIDYYTSTATLSGKIVQREGEYEMNSPYSEELELEDAEPQPESALKKMEERRR